MKTTLCLGPCCSGKTTWSIEQVRNNENLIRFSLDEFRTMATGDLLFDKIDSKFMRLIYNNIINISTIGRDLILDNIPLEFSYLNMIEQFSQKIEVRLFDVELKDALIRNKLRKSKGGHFVKPFQMAKYNDNYQRFILSDTFRNFITGQKVGFFIENIGDIHKQILMV